MQYEINKVREQHDKIGLPTRDKAPAVFPPDERHGRARSVRMATDGLIRQGINNQNIMEIAVGVAETMTSAAGTCIQFGLEPDLSDALVAARELMEDARLVLVNGLAVSEHAQVRIGACMLEIVCVGIAQCFGIPYKAIFDLAHAAYMEGKEISREAVRVAIEESRQKVPAAANDAGAP